MKRRRDHLGDVHDRLDGASVSGPVWPSRGDTIEKTLADARSASSADDWQATKLLEQLIAADRGRWAFYQGLGDAQRELGEFGDSATWYKRGEIDSALASCEPAIWI